MSKKLNWEKRTIRNGLFEFENRFFCLIGYPGNEDGGMEILVAKNRNGDVVVKGPKKGKK
ncbi:hypothetical protein ACFPVS_09200 [Neisseria weixii]|uniref:hypothetical protein n=1 Tax=Neisseria weixii TaxID=1853276 RepID=UPI00361565F8